MLTRTVHTVFNTSPNQHHSDLHAKEDRIGSLQYQIARLQRQIDLLSASSSSGGAAGVAVSQPLCFVCVGVCVCCV